MEIKKRERWYKGGERIMIVESFERGNKKRKKDYSRGKREEQKKGKKDGEWFEREKKGRRKEEEMEKKERKKEKKEREKRKSVQWLEMKNRVGGKH